VALVDDGYCESTSPLTCNDGLLGPALLTDDGRTVRVAAIRHRSVAYRVDEAGSS
jgi:hypothetical protein